MLQSISCLVQKWYMYFACMTRPVEPPASFNHTSYDCVHSLTLVPSATLAYPSI